VTDERPPERAAAWDETAPSAEDVARIGRLADDLLPALAAKLRATGLGEIEVRQGPWKVRLRRPADGGPEQNRRATDRPSRSQPGHHGHGHPPAAIEGHRGGRQGAAGADGLPGGYSTNGTRPGGEATGDDQRPERGRDRRAMAISPAVGVFGPGPAAKPGNRVRGGDRLGVVDMLGVPHEVVAPGDGIVGETLVEPGQAVEYGQELVVIELVAAAGTDR
jgi:biotin carboxyl carrier protein